MEKPIRNADGSTTYVTPAAMKRVEPCASAVECADEIYNEAYKPDDDYLRFDFGKAKSIIQSTLDTYADKRVAEATEWRPIETAPKDGMYVTVKGRDFAIDEDGFGVVPNDHPPYEVLAYCILPTREEDGFSWRTQIVGCLALRPTHWKPAPQGEKK